MAEQPKGAAHAVNRHAELPTGLFPIPQWGTTHCHRQEVGAPVPSPTPRPRSAGLRASLLHAFLAKAIWQAGTAGWGDDAGGRGRKASRGPLAPSHCLRAEAPMTSIHSQLVGGEVVKAIKGNENSKHLAMMSPWGKQGHL